MFPSSLRLPTAWNWGGLSIKELMVRTCKALGEHRTIDRAAIVAFYAMLALVPFLGLVLTFALGTSDGILSGEILSSSEKGTQDCLMVNAVSIST